MGATYTIKVTSRDSRALAKEVESTLGCKPDRSIECSGVEASIATAIYVRMSAVQLDSYVILACFIGHSFWWSADSGGSRHTRSQDPHSGCLGQRGGHQGGVSLLHRMVIQHLAKMSTK